MSKILSKLEHAQKDGKRNIREHLKFKCRRRRFETPPESRVKQGAVLERESESNSEVTGCCQIGKKSKSVVSGHKKLSEAVEVCQIGKGHFYFFHNSSLTQEAVS